MIDPKQFVSEVVAPTLADFGFNSRAARRLLLGTAIAESGLIYLRQHASGPAMGVYQIEPATHRDLYKNFLAFRPGLIGWVRSFAAFPHDSRDTPQDAQLLTNLAYATVIARLIYFRRPEALPDADDLQGLAAYWKAHYNTAAGAGTVEYFLRKTRKYLEDVK